MSMNGQLVLGIVLTAVAVQDLSAPAIVARAREVDLRIRDVRSRVTMTIERDDETKRRRFDIIVQRDGPRYRARIEVVEPAPMRGVRFLILAERGKRNQQWSYFPDLDLTREVPGSRQDDAFLGSDLSYADLAGSAHLDDLRHQLIGEETVDGEACFHLRGVPRRRIVYGALEGWVSQSRFTTVKARFFDNDGNLVKEARLHEPTQFADEVWLARRIVVEATGSRTELNFEEIRVNEGVEPGVFSPEELAR